MKKILFITHEMTRTGAPLVLLHFLQWFKRNHQDVHISVLTLLDGDLKDKFIEVSDDYFDLSQVDSPKFNYFSKFRRLGKRIGINFKKSDSKETHLRKLATSNYNLIYANSVVSIPVACKIKKYCKAKLITHFHELETMVKIMQPNLSSYVGDIDGYIAVSDLVKNYLVENHEVDPRIIKVIYPFSKVPDVSLKKDKDIFVIGGAGAIGWAKRVDLFILIAYYIKNHYPVLNVKFVWVGKVPPFEDLIISDDLKKSGLTDMVNFVGEKDEVEFLEFDLFLLTSREESFGLVALEAAMLSIPVLCFEKVSGFSEILEKEGVQTFSYLNIEGIAEKVVEYYNNRLKLKKDGEVIKTICSKFIPEFQGPKVSEFIKRFLE